MSQADFDLASCVPARPSPSTSPPSTCSSSTSRTSARASTYSATLGTALEAAAKAREKISRPDRVIHRRPPKADSDARAQLHRPIRSRCAGLHVASSPGSSTPSGSSAPDPRSCVASAGRPPLVRRHRPAVDESRPLDAQPRRCHALPRALPDREHSVSMGRGTAYP